MRKVALVFPAIALLALLMFGIKSMPPAFALSLATQNNQAATLNSDTTTVTTTNQVYLPLIEGAAPAEPTADPNEPFVRPPKKTATPTRTATRTPTPPTPTKTPTTVPQVGDCAFFPADNIWNVAVDTLPVAANSATYINTIGSSKYVHADFGSGLWDGGPIGIPFVRVASSQPKVAVSFDYADESDPGPYPIPGDAPIEGGANSTGDRHVLVLENDNCLLYELYAAYPQADGSWQAGSGAIFDLKSNALRPAGWTSADAAGLPILPGLVRYDEVASGEIRHAIRFTVPQTRRTYVWPARHYASTLTDAQYPPMGQRFRLKASFDISGYSPQVQVILRAMKKYGIILADNGSSWFISGAPDERWNNTMLRELHKVLGSNFEAVDVSSLTINQDSGQAKTTIATPTPINTPRNTATATYTPTNTNTPTNTPTHTPTNTPTSIPPNSMTECVVTRSTATTATFASSHPKVLLNHQATKDCLKQLLTNGVPVATRFKNYVDTQLANGNQWNYQNWHTALIYQLTNDSKYAIDAVAKVDAYVASEEALISQGKIPEIAYDHYLHVGDRLSEVMLVYDWCYEYLTESQRTRWLNFANQAVWNVWNFQQDTWVSDNNGWAVDNPFNNFYYSFLRATMLVGLASHGENNQAQTWIDTFRTVKLENRLFPAFSATLQGGGSLEGTGYGASFMNLFQIYDWWERSTGERIATRTPHTLASLGFFIHNIAPTLDRIAPTGDHARESTGAFYDYHRTYLLELMTLFPEERMSGVAKMLLSQSSLPSMSSNNNYFADFLYNPPVMPSYNLSELATAYWGSGTGQFLTRSSWQKTATYANFICGPYVESHAHRDQGSFVLFKNSWLAMDANIQSHSGIEQNEQIHNLVRIEQAGETVIQRVERSPCTMLALADNSYFSYGLADVTPIYDNHPAVGKVEREFLFFKPDTFVIFDRVATVGDGVKRIWTLNTPGMPTIDGDHLSYAEAGQQLDVYRLAPVGLTTEITAATVIGENVPGKRLEAVDSAGSQTLFLHVLTTAAPPISPYRSDIAGQTGAQVALADGRSVLIRFANAGHGGTIELRAADGSSQYNGPLPTTVTAPPLFAAN